MAIEDSEQTSMSRDGVAPRLRLDELLEELVSRAGEVLAARDALRKLLTANRAIMGELSLPDVLTRVIEAACQLVGARYGALGVLGADGKLVQFVHTGMDPDQVSAIGPLPRGRGLLGALIIEPTPIRLTNIGDDPRSVGFPAHHPPMHSFLGVPIRLRDAIYGNLYLTESLSGAFTEEDTELVTALAGTAAIAVENARLYEEAQRRQQWLQASTEITQRLLTSPGDDAMAMIADQVREMADADVVTVVLPTGADRLTVAAASGDGREELQGLTYPREQTLSQLAIDTGEAVRLVQRGDESMPLVHLNDVLQVGPVMALPLVGSGRARGALLVGRLDGRTPFSVAELDMAATFAGHAAVALELADARSAKDRVALLEDRDRIARDLHDHVIQRLFAAGLTLQSMIGAVGRAKTPDQTAADRLTTVVEDIDDTIRQIRTTIFALQAPSTDTASLRTRLLGLIDGMASSAGLTPEVRFAGPVDTAVSEPVAEDLLAVVREALANVAKHAAAKRVSVTVAVRDDAVTVDVVDDGSGPGSSTRRSGLANLDERATARGGSFKLSAGQTGGSTLSWSAPIR